MQLEIYHAAPSPHALLALLLSLLIPALLSGPLLRLLQVTTAHEQLHHAALIFLLAAIALLMEEKQSLPRQLHADRDCLTLLSGALLFSLLSLFWPNFLLLAITLALALSGWLHLAYGPGIQRLSRALSLSFLLFVLLAQLFAATDWPLRQMAGVYSAWMLQQLGLSTQLFVQQGNEIKLILTANQHPFEVASECNGYGLISSSALLALMLATYHRIHWLDKILTLTIALFLGSLFNLLRILAIVLLAPYVGSHYLLMHEIVGSLFFWACLILVWLLPQGFKPGSPAQNTQQASTSKTPPQTTPAPAATGIQRGSR
ncbi:MAG: exosortase/archaeosortase family protein [Blastochloris sp.]|nr:exosortase/archaeosortase family protein [Blastochloris sp.]